MKESWELAEDFWRIEMNANELADLMIQFDSGRIYEHAEEIATMLRQQQAEIEALKQIIDANNLNQNIGQFVKPTNEPVAWMIKTLDGRSLMLYGEEQPPKFKDDVQYIPLYTHPVKEQLTDEEINVVAILQDAEIVPVEHEIWKTSEEFNKYKRIVLATAKALRKAQE